ncbi:MAG: bifunctional 5,10-methylenetetrahydrofolate dehydrogenase/5,10-methenyltetrahydrofolate cyclohydrolase [Candidatus Woesearchaeota archaeon]
MEILDGKKLSEKITEELKAEINNLNENIKLSVIMVGYDPASAYYVNMKKKKCNEIGIQCDVISLDGNAMQEKVIETIRSLNNDSNVTGILVQLPLPSHINTRKVLDSVRKEKDADGLSTYHLSRLLLNEEKIAPATPKGVIRLLEEYKIEVKGKNICIIGYGNTVGKPLSLMLLNREATVDICHIRTEYLKEHTIKADILISAAGVPGLIKADMTKEGAVIVDIGINKVGNEVRGDVDFDDVKEKCSYITPVPGGVGPMTIVMLIDNLIRLKETYN